MVKGCVTNVVVTYILVKTFHELDITGLMRDSRPIASTALGESVVHK